MLNVLYSTGRDIFFKKPNSQRAKALDPKKDGQLHPPVGWYIPSILYQLLYYIIIFMVRQQYNDMCMVYGYDLHITPRSRSS